MITSSEYVVIIVIWALTLVGVFFGGRAAWRRRRHSRPSAFQNPVKRKK